MAKVRLDALLAERGLLPSRSRAAASIMAGEVRVRRGPAGADAETVLKPGAQVEADAEVELRAAPAFVSRGGTKLANALDALGVAVAGRRALDVGASTGGFTDCLLQRGAAHVVALDVAYGELAWSVRTDPRVTVLERRNARALTADDLPYAPDLLVADVSFISLTKVLPALAAVLSPRAEALVMVKPQFEVGRDRVGKGGVVREPELRRAAIVQVAEAADAAGLVVRGLASSGLPGPRGNRESFLHLGGDADARAIPPVPPADLAGLLDAVEPLGAVAGAPR